MDSRLTAKLSRIYYSPRGYWKGVTAIKHLASAAKVSEDVAKDWLKRQAIWQIYLPAPRRIPRPRFDVSTPNKVHQADLLFLPHDRLPRGKKVYKYALTVVDVASRFKEAEPLTSKTAAEVGDALSRIYKRGPLKWPKLLQVDPGRQFMGAAGQLLAKHGVLLGVVVWTFTGTRASWNTSTAPWLNGYSGISRHKNLCWCTWDPRHRVSGRGSGWKGSLRSLPPWMERWQGWLASGLEMWLSKNRCRKIPLQWSQVAWWV